MTDVDVVSSTTRREAARHDAPTRRVGIAPVRPRFGGRSQQPHPPKGHAELIGDGSLEHVGDGSGWFVEAER